MAQTRHGALRRAAVAAAAAAAAQLNDSNSEPSSSDEDCLTDDESQTPAVRGHGKRRRRGRKQPAARRTQQPAPQRHVDDSFSAHPGSHQVFPNWLELPEPIWTEIFLLAAESDAMTVDPSSTTWLAQTLLLCRGLHSATIRAFFRHPRFKKKDGVKRLTYFLETVSEETPNATYGSMIKSLYLDIRTIPRPFHLLAHTPLLRHLDFFSTHPPDVQFRWRYGDFLEELGIFVADESTLVRFEADKSPISLRTFSWNLRMLSTKWDVEALKHIHRTARFQRINRIELVGFQAPSFGQRLPREDDLDAIQALEYKDEAYATKVSEALDVLPDLQHLSFKSSSIIDECFLPLLPTNLRSLTLDGCSEVRSDDFSDFLLTHGTHLEYLGLFRNQALDLSFLPVLGNCCPQLQELYIDLKCHHQTNSVWHDGRLYDEILLVGQVPTWPESLRVVNVENVEGWSTESAEMFFDSLVRSAPRLPMLRHLSIKAMLSIPWRLRAEFRKMWEEKLCDVFLRPRRNPMPQNSLRSSKSRELEKAGTRTKKRKRPPHKPLRQSGRIATKLSIESSRTNSLSRAARKRQRQNYAEPDTDEFDTESEDDDVDSQSQPDDELSDAPEDTPDISMSGHSASVQGRCSVVDIIINNQKPTEYQLGFDDFMDSDPVDEEDEDWDGDDDFYL